MINMAGKIKYKGVSLPSELIDEVDEVIKHSPRYASRADFVREAIDDKLKPNRTQISHLTREDKTILELIAQDHWQQYHSFEEDELKDSIRANFRINPQKPNNLSWLVQAVEFCCSLKRS